MAIIHERLYRSKIFTNIDFGEYLQDWEAILSARTKKMESPSM